ncbi:hypothetical protein K7432_001610 [Basidiobolus ranarum]|uniref:Protein kinase domain-containing protein n=1 Tax=Basidiobolus ranarum TaxID=34480 RepID=A0ABR2W957_9FUNG
MTSVQEAEADHTTSTLATVPEIKETTIAPTVTSVQEVEADHTTATMATIPEVKEIAVTPNVPSVQEVEDRHTTSTVTTVPEAEEVTITPRMASAQEVEDDHIISTVATVSEVKEASDVTSVQEVADRHATSTVTIVPEAEEVTITPRMTPTQEVDAEADRTTSTLSTVPEAKEVTIAPTVTSTQEVEDDYTNATLVTIPETNEIAITPTVLSIQEVEAEHTISASIGENHVGQNLILAEDHVVVEKVPTDRLSSPNATINDAKVTVTSKDRGAILEAELPVENLESTIDLHDYDSPIIEANKDTSVDTPQKLYDISQMDKNISCNEDRFTPSPILFESAPLRTPDTKDLTLLETSNDLSMSFEAQISDDEEAAIVFPSSGNQSMMSSVVETPKLESLSLFEGDAENSTFSGAEPDTRDVVEDSVGVPYSPLEEIPLTSPTPVTESIQTSSDLENRTLDELEEAYICTRFPEPKIFHKATYILDRLFAMAFSRAFISPFGTAHLYEPPLGGLNLTIIDRKLWHGKYKTFEGFVEDLREVAEAVKLNYDDKDEIYFISKEFINFFEDLAWELRSNSSETPEKQEVAPFSEQELKMIKGLECTEDSPFYIVKLATLAEVVRSNRGLLEKETFAAVHHPFFEDFGSTPDILTGTTENALPTVLRIFISHNRTALELARDEQNGFLLVFTNVTMSKVETKGHIRLQADCFVTKPIGKRHDIEDVEILQSLDSMKSWIKVAVLKAFKFDAEVPSRFRTYHLKPYRPVKYDPSTIGEHPLSQIIMEAKNHWDPNIVKERQLAMSGDSREFTPQPKMKAPVRKHPTRTRSVSTTKKKAKVKMNLTSTPKRTDEDSKMDVSTPESPTFKGSLQTRIRTDGDDASSDDRFLLPTFPKEIMKKEIESQLSSEAEDVNIDIVGMDVDTEFPDFASRSIANQAQIRSELTVRIEQVSDSISDDSPFQLIELTQNAVEPTSSEKEFARESNSDFSTRQLLSEAKVLYSRIKETGLKLGVHFENRESIEQHLSQRYVVGQFKNVHVSASDVNIVVQIYKGIGRELIESRLMELACLLKLRGLKRVGEILSIVESDDGIPTGLTMNRYQKTLKQYLHIRYNISPQQKYKLMRDLIAAVKVLHDLGIAHRNLSEENIMVNEIEGIFLKDGTLRPKVFLIDYGKARFTRREDIQRWYLYPLAPEEEKLLPRITSTPDHGYKRYRSIKTLPRSKNDIATLSHDINPFAEDIYSLGVLLWRIFTQQCPLACVFEDDILGLRQIVSDEHRLRTEICKAIPGSKCRELLFGCLAVNDVDRWSVDELSKWIWNQQNRKQLIYEIERDFNGKGV